VQPEPERADDAEVPASAAQRPEQGGVIVGGRLASTVDPARLQRWFIVLLLAVATYTAIDAISGLR